MGYCLSVSRLGDDTTQCALLTMCMKSSLWTVSLGSELGLLSNKRYVDALLKILLYNLHTVKALLGLYKHESWPSNCGGPYGVVA